MGVYAIIGKNFGDEGKGLATDWYALKAQKNNKTCLGIRHNGGAQAGHTVDLEGKRFIFHQLSSGSFRMADTLWAPTFLPDMYKIADEVKEFETKAHFIPKIMAFGECRCVIIDDILLNMALENSRGDQRHGSCGMGINEAVQRSKNPEYVLTLREIKENDSQTLFEKLLYIRKQYLPKRMEELELTFEKCGDYADLLTDESVLENYAAEIVENSKLVELTDEKILSRYEDIIFEGAQGLLLDDMYKRYRPYLTTSRTGLTNPSDFTLRYMNGAKIEAVYVSRTYVTRHGRGPLPCEDISVKEVYKIKDYTNIPNEWQETLRFARHESDEAFLEEVKNDLKNAKNVERVTLFLTHISETDGEIIFEKGNERVDEWIEKEEIRKVFDNVIKSFTPYAEDIIQ